MGELKRIDWNALDPRNRAAMDEVSVTASATIRAHILSSAETHKAAGRPIYYRNSAGQMVKELPDGRRWVVRLDEQDREIELYELKAS